MAWEDLAGMLLPGKSPACWGQGLLCHHPLGLLGAGVLTLHVQFSGSPTLRQKQRLSRRKQTHPHAHPHLWLCSSRRVQKGKGGQVRLPPEPLGAPWSPGVQSSGPGAALACPGSDSCPAVRVVCAAFFLFAAHTAGARGWWTRYLSPLLWTFPP